MSYYRKTIVPNIEAHYENLSAVEKNIADFFISNEEDMDFSSRHISSMLYVSEASLSRFAKKCGNCEGTEQLRLYKINAKKRSAKCIV